VLACFLRAPVRGEVPDVARVAITRRQYTPLEMLKTPPFYVMYAMFVMMAAGGLMATAQLGPIAKDFKIADVPVSLVGLTMPALVFALSIDRILNGLTRPFFGWVSDHLGRENTMFAAFALEGAGIWMISLWGHDPVAFVLLTGLVFFAWGEIYSLFPATCGDSYGVKYATTNAGLLYTAKGTASLLVPLSSYLTAWTGSWYAVFITASVPTVTSTTATRTMTRGLFMVEFSWFDNEPTVNVWRCCFAAKVNACFSIRRKNQKESCYFID